MTYGSWLSYQKVAKQLEASGSSRPKHADADGYVERFKAHLVAQGLSQKFGLDYDETFCSVVRLESVRALIALSVQQGLQLHQVDETARWFCCTWQ